MTFTAVALAVLVLASEAYAASFVGCIGLLNLPVSVPQLPASSLAQCQSYCTVLPFAYWAASTQGCYCSSFGPTARGVQSGSLTSCSGYVATKIETTFSDAACYTTVTTDSRDASSPSSTVTSVDTCFDNCRNYRYAITKPQTGLLSSWTCKCANFPYTTSGSGCTSSSNYVYTHSAAAAASGLARREVKEEAKREQLALAANPYCPPSYTACYVSETEDDGYECIRPEAELESCGGCRLGEYKRHNNATLGIDCTSISGVVSSAVTCTEGRCVVSRCRRGYRLFQGACIPRATV